MLTGSSLPFRDLSADKSTPLLCLISGFQMVACITLTSLRAVSVYLHVKWLFEQLYRSWVTGFSLHLISQAAVQWQLVDIRLYSQSLLKLRDVLRQRERGDREQLSLAFTPHPSLTVLFFSFSVFLAFAFVCLLCSCLFLPVLHFIPFFVHCLYFSFLRPVFSFSPFCFAYPSFIVSFPSYLIYFPSVFIYLFFHSSLASFFPFVHFFLSSFLLPFSLSFISIQYLVSFPFFLHSYFHFFSLVFPLFPSYPPFSSVFNCLSWIVVLYYSFELIYT